VSGWLRGVVFRNFSLKVIALALAVLLHILVRPTNHGRSVSKARATTRVKQEKATAVPDAGAPARPGARRGRPGRAGAPAPATTQPAATQPTSLPVP